MAHANGESSVTNSNLPINSDLPVVSGRDGPKDNSSVQKGLVATSEGTPLDPTTSIQKMPSLPQNEYSEVAGATPKGSPSTVLRKKYASESQDIPKAAVAKYSTLPVPRSAPGHFEDDSSVIVQDVPKFYKRDLLHIIQERNELKERVLQLEDQLEETKA